MLNKEKRKQYLEANKERIKEQKKINYLNNKDKFKSRRKEWEANNKDKIRANQKRRLENDPLFKLKTNMKNLIGNSFRNGDYKKLSKTELILGCSYIELKIHLESKFEPWMNWDNRGIYNGTPDSGWDVDHIIPLSSATNSQELIRLNHHSNLQPLCSYINRVIKRNT